MKREITWKLKDGRQATVAHLIDIANGDTREVPEL